MEHVHSALNAERNLEFSSKGVVGGSVLLAAIALATVTAVICGWMEQVAHGPSASLIVGATLLFVGVLGRTKSPAKTTGIVHRN